MAYWEQRLKAPFDPKCERIPHDGDSVWALRSDHFNHLQTADDVKNCAITLITSLNGALALEGNAEPLTLQSVGCIDSKGQISFTSFAGMHERARATGEFVMVEARDASGNLIPSPPPKPSQAQEWVKGAEGNADIAKAFKHFGQPTNWYDMWTAYEIIEEDLSKHTPKARQPKGRDKMKRPRVLLLNQNWVSEAELCRFAESCNYHRHGAKKPPEPKQDATTNEARQILAQIFRAWLKTKLS